MHPQLQSIFDEAENRYLKPEELGTVSQYVESLPSRLETYRKMRDSELSVMQQVADQLQVELPNEKVEHLERSIKNALLVLRYCAMGMLLNDEDFVKSRLLSWLQENVKAYNSQTIDSALYRLLNQGLNQTFSPQQMALLNPMLSLAQDALLGQPTISSIGW
ncbi:MAG TPA: phycobilisome protein [Chroococcidiopsis sp.]